MRDFKQGMYFPETFEQSPQCPFRGEINKTVIIIKKTLQYRKNGYKNTN